MNRPARVLHILKYYWPDFSGEGVFLERSSAVMQELAPTVEHELLVTHTPRPASATQRPACSVLRRVTYLSPRPLGTIGRHARLAAWFVANLHRFDTIHVRTHADWYFISYLLSKIAGKRLVLSATLDDSVPKLVSHYRQSLQPLATRGFAVFDGYVSISTKLYDENVAFGIDPGRSHLVPCGVTVPPQPPAERDRVRAILGAGPDDPVLLFVGGLCVRKDPLFLVEALPAVRAAHPGVRLALVGPPLEPDYVAVLEATVGALGLGEAVFLAGEQKNPHPWFAAADILVFASRSEGFGTVVPEAMAHGRPVVVRELPGVNDSFVIQGQTGFRFTDQPGYVTFVLRLLGDAPLRERIGREARRFAQERFAMRAIAARYLGIYGQDGRIENGEPPGTPETGLGCTASITDRRFHTPVAISPAAQPLLITTVDAEEQFDWSGPFSRTAHDVSAMAQQHRAHRVFERHGVVPLYFVDYPVAAQEEGRAPLREFLADRRCEIGAQMHPWVTPPFREQVNARNSFAGNLPTALEREKARILTDTLADAFGERPLIYRTGRFGGGTRTADVLKQLGYLADSSLAVCWPPDNRRRDDDHWALRASPYWLDPERTLMEIPNSEAMVGHLAERFGPRLAPFVFNGIAERAGLAGAMARFSLLERIRLSPEGMTLDEAKRLVRHMLSVGHRVFVLTYHSPTLAPGNTPYTRTDDDVERFLAWLDAFYTFFREEAGGRMGSWRDVRFGNATLSGPGARG